jgi:uncharacterized protein YhbP (UPF0306 family)
MKFQLSALSRQPVWMVEMVGMVDIVLGFGKK